MLVGAAASGRMMFVTYAALAWCRHAQHFNEKQGICILNMAFTVVLAHIMLGSYFQLQPIPGVTVPVSSE
jgi:hypothetical protein